MSLQNIIFTQLLNKPMSLAELQDVTKASLPTVRRAVQTLSEGHWIHIVGQAGANGGRPANLFGIDDSHYMVFGLQLQLPGIRLITSDLTGKVLMKRDFFPGEVPEPNAAIRIIVDAIDEFKTSLPNRQALGLGIAAPGFVDSNTGDIIAIGRVPSWVNFPIFKHLSEATGLSLHIANDVDCMASAEFAHNNDPSGKNLVYIGFCEGIKASLFLQGELYTGSLGNVGLISPDLLNIPKAEDQAEIKRLITTLGFIEVFEERVKKLERPLQSFYDPILHLNDPNKKFRLIIERALSDKKICYPIVKDLICVVSVAFAILIQIIQPDEIVVGGLLSGLPDELFLDLKVSVREIIPPLMSNNLIIKRGSMESESKAAIGASYNFLLNNLSELLEDL